MNLKYTGKLVGWITWGSIIMALYGAGWKFGFEIFMSDWKFQDWVIWDWMIFLSALCLAHAGLFLLMLVIPLLLKKYVGFKDGKVKNNKA